MVKSNLRSHDVGASLQWFLYFEFKKSLGLKKEHEQDTRTIIPTSTGIISSKYAYDFSTGTICSTCED